MKHATEYKLRENALNDSKISLVLTHKCLKSRNVNYRSCEGNCADKIGTFSDAFQAVKTLRQSIWIDPDSLVFNYSTNNNGGLDIRKSAFIKAILNMSGTNNSGDAVINYKIEGKDVCKNFYYRATGFSKKMFNRGIGFMLSSNAKTNPEHDYSDFSSLISKPVFAHVCGHTNRFPQLLYQQNIKDPPNGEVGVIAFLDIFFKGHCDVDNAPEESNVKYVRLAWTGVYEEYVKHCNSIPINAVPYNLFTSIRYYAYCSYLFFFLMSYDM